MNTEMKLVDHYHFLLDDVTKTRRDVNRIINSRFSKKSKISTEKMIYLLNLRLDNHFLEKELKIKALIATESMLERASAGE